MRSLPYHLRDFTSASIESMPHNSSVDRVDWHALQLDVIDDQYPRKPRNFQEASLDPSWTLAMQDEIDTICRNDTLELTDLPLGKRAVTVKWV